MAAPERKPRAGESEPVLTHRAPRPRRPDPVDESEAERGDGRRPAPAPGGNAGRDPPDAEDLH